MFKIYNWLGKFVMGILEKVVVQWILICGGPLAVAGLTWFRTQDPIMVCLTTLIVVVTVLTVSVFALAKQQNTLVQAMGFKIIKATWGTPNNYRDVTGSLRRKVVGDQLDFDGEKNSLAGDPARNNPSKKMRIWYLAAKDYDENEAIHLP